MKFIASNTSYFKVLKIDYHEGQRYLYLERVKDVLEEILKPMAPLR